MAHHEQDEQDERAGGPEARGRTQGPATVRVRTLALGAAAVLALGTAYALGAAGGPAGASTVATSTVSTKDVPTLTMTGTGTATVVPDQLRYTVTVTKRATTLDEALSDASAATRKVLAALERFEVGEDDVRTTGLTMAPRFGRIDGERRLTGYTVSQRVAVEVDRLGVGGRTIDAVVDAGGYGVDVQGISLGVADPEAQVVAARREAIDDARAKARAYADATGQELTRVVSLREGSDDGGSTAKAWAGPVDTDARLDRAAVPIRAGEQELDVDVTVVWQLG